MTRTSIVVRPMAVRPVSTGPTQAKCSCQVPWRGWNSRVNNPVSGSRPPIFGPLWRLSFRQDNAEFSATVGPWCCSGNKGPPTQCELAILGQRTLLGSQNVDGPCRTPGCVPVPGLTSQALSLGVETDELVTAPRAGPVPPDPGFRGRTCSILPPGPHGEDAGRRRPG